MSDFYDEDEIFYDDIQEGNGGWEPEEEDLATNGYELWELTNSGGTWVSNGRTWDLGNDWQGSIKQIMDDMSYWPNVWWVDDHGGMQLVEWDTVQQ